MHALIAAALLLAQEGKWERQEEIEQVRTRTAYVPSGGEIEIDVVGSFLQFNDDGVRRREMGVAVEIEVGITSWLMVEVEAPYRSIRPEAGGGVSGRGDVGLELKAGIPGHWRGVELAFGATVALPTGDEDKGLGAGATQVGGFVATSYRHGRMAVHLDFGVEVEPGERPHYQLNAAFDATPGGRALAIFVAMIGDILPGESPAWSMVPGFEFRFENPHLQFGVGVPIGVTDSAARWGIIVDIEIEF